MKIAIVHSFYSSKSPSGENRVVQLQVSALQRAGHEVALLSVRTDELGGSVLYSFASAMRVATGRGRSPIELIKAFAPDVVHVHNLFPNYGTAWLRDVSAPVVATLHNFRPLCAAGILARNGQDCVECPTLGSHRSIINRCYRGSAAATLPLAIATRGGGSRNGVLANADALVCLAPRSRDTYARFGPQLSEKIHVVPNFSPDPGVPSELDPESPWVFVGRLTEEKGILELAKSWPSDRSLVIVGSGPLGVQVKAACEGKRVRLTGQLSADEVQTVLRASRAMVFPSTWREGAPAMTYVESLAAGRPALALGGNAVSDDIESGHSGLVIPSLRELYGSLEELDANLKAFSVRARQRFQSEFSESVWLSRIQETYKSVQ